MDTMIIAESVKEYLVSLAINDQLPMDMNDISEYGIEEAIKKVLPSEQDKAIELASHYLSDGDLSTKEMIEAIAKHDDQEDLIDTVEGVVVWQKVEYSFTCEEFLKEIGWGLL